MTDSDAKYTLTPAARDVLLCLFLHGPTYDGDVPSKTGRDELYEAALIGRSRGFQWLLIPGIDLCFSLGFDNDKAKYQHGQRRVRQDAERYATMKADPVGGRHLLQLLKEGKGDADAFDSMLDRLKVSRDNAMKRSNKE